MRFKRVRAAALRVALAALEADLREVEFVAELPLATTGKIMRRRREGSTPSAGARKRQRMKHQTPAEQPIKVFLSSRVPLPR